MIKFTTSHSPSRSSQTSSLQCSTFGRDDDTIVSWSLSKIDISPKRFPLFSLRDGYQSTTCLCSESFSFQNLLDCIEPYRTVTAVRSRQAVCPLLRTLSLHVIQGHVTACHVTSLVFLTIVNKWNGEVIGWSIEEKQANHLFTRDFFLFFLSTFFKCVGIICIPMSDECVEVALIHGRDGLR